MTNPNNAVGTPAAFKGRTSVKAFNNITGAYTRGIISGWGCAPVSGMTVAVGGSAGIRDIAVAEDASGNRTTISNISEAPIEVTLEAAPTTYNRIDSIVLYVQPSPEGDSSTQDNPAACGIVAVKGTPAANAVAPDDAAIRSAITTDGGTGTTAYYVVITNITVGVGVTTITSGVIDMPKPSVAMVRPAVETANCSANTTIPISTTNYTTIPLSHRYGDNTILQVKSNKIVIPAGITEVKLCAYFNVWVASSSGTYNTFCRISRTRNGSTTEIINVPWQFAGPSGLTTRNAITIPPIASDAQEGDEFGLEMQVYSGPSSSAVVVHGGTYLTVEER